jgi:DNA-binding NtrC family response regulator
MKCHWEPGRTLRSIKISAVEDALEYFGGNKTLAAHDLGISIRSLRLFVQKCEELARFREGPDRNLHRTRMQLAEMRIITQALRIAKGSRQGAADILGMNRTTLLEKMRRYGFLNGAPALPEPKEE